MEKTTISGLSRATGLPETTVRRYIEQFNISPVAGGNKKKLYPVDTTKKLLTIRELFNQGLDREQAQKALGVYKAPTVEKSLDLPATLNKITHNLELVARNTEPKPVFRFLRKK